MKIKQIIWLPEIVEKNEWKHHVIRSEVEEVLYGKKQARKVTRGNVKGEDVYLILGKTDSGRHLSVFFILKKDGSILPISARDMDKKERKRFRHGK